MRRADIRHGRNPEIITRSKTMFDLPIKKKRDGSLKVPSGSCLYVCFQSDFFIEEADGWRKEAWDLIKERSDVWFLIPTKRVHRIHQCLPADWNDGWPNVSFALSIENNQAARERLDQFLKIPCCHRSIFAAPLLEELDLTHWLETGKIELVSVAGESGLKARVCHFNWMEKIFYDCLKTKTKFTIHQTGRYFVRNGRCYTIPKKEQFSQAKRAHEWLKKEAGKKNQPSLFD